MGGVVRAARLDIAAEDDGQAGMIRKLLALARRRIDGVDRTKAAKRCVETLKGEGAEIIVCLSHSGTGDSLASSEDEELAKAVDGIDVIISGHTHSATQEPIRVNDTLIVSCGEYTRNLGVLTVEKTGEGLDTLDFRLVPIDETVTEDAAMTAMARRFQQKVDEGYLAGFGLSFHQVLCESAFAFTPIRRFAQQQQEDPLGSLIADSYVYAVEQAEGEDYRTVVFAVVAAGVVRASFAAGEITTSDAFNVSSLGSGADGTPGYPLVSVWLTGRELKDVFEVDASVTPLMPAAQLYPAGMRWTYNPRPVQDHQPGLARRQLVHIRVPAGQGNARVQNLAHGVHIFDLRRDHPPGLGHVPGEPAQIINLHVVHLSYFLRN